jgi:hypothetical protein
MRELEIQRRGHMEVMRRGTAFEEFGNAEQQQWEGAQPRAPRISPRLQYLPAEDGWGDAYYYQRTREERLDAGSSEDD